MITIVEIAGFNKQKWLESRGNAYILVLVVGIALYMDPLSEKMKLRVVRASSRRRKLEKLGWRL